MLCCLWIRVHYSHQFLSVSTKVHLFAKHHNKHSSYQTICIVVVAVVAQCAAELLC